MNSMKATQAGLGDLEKLPTRAAVVQYMNSRWQWNYSVQGDSVAAVQHILSTPAIGRYDDPPPKKKILEWWDIFVTWFYASVFFRSKGAGLWDIIHALEQEVQSPKFSIVNPFSANREYEKCIWVLSKHYPKSDTSNEVRALKQRWKEVYLKLLTKWRKITPLECNHLLVQSLSVGDGYVVTPKKFWISLSQDTHSYQYQELPHYAYSNKIIVRAIWESLQSAGSSITSQQYETLLQEVVWSEMPQRVSSMYHRHFQHVYGEAIPALGMSHESDLILGIIEEVASLDSIDFDAHTQDRLKSPLLIWTKSRVKIRDNKASAICAGNPFRIQDLLENIRSIKEWEIWDWLQKDISLIKSYWVIFLERRMQALEAYIAQYWFTKTQNIYSWLVASGILTQEEQGRADTHAQDHAEGLKRAMNLNGWGEYHWFSTIDFDITQPEIVTFADLERWDIALIQTIRDA